MSATRVDETAARDELEVEAHRYYELFELAPGSYVETDTDGVIRLANLATGEMLSVRQERLLGAELVEFVSAEDREAFTRCLGRLQQGDEATGWDTRVQPSAGPPIDVFVAVRRGWDGGGEYVLRWLLHDVTGRRDREQQVEEPPIGRP